MRVLAITLGGSPKPIVRSIQVREPQWVVFFGSTQPNGGSIKEVAFIQEQTGLREGSFSQVGLENPDDLNGCFERMVEELRRVEEEFRPTEKLADYTGGTKSMTAALVLAALYLDWDLALVTGPRADLKQVIPGTESAILMSAATIKWKLLEGQIKAFMEAHHYSAADALIQRILQHSRPSDPQYPELLRQSVIMRGLEAWERFNYSKALELLRTLAKEDSEAAQALKHLGPLAKAEEKKCFAYEHVQDLFGNALRRAQEGRYDDAILRLYRAVEFLAQARLQKAHGLNADDLDLSKIPEPLRSELAARGREGDQRVRAGLFDCFRILQALKDPLGQLFTGKWERNIRQLLFLRNQSFLVHGVIRAGEKEWQAAYGIVQEFFAEAAKTLEISLDPPQWPRR